METKKKNLKRKVKGAYILKSTCDATVSPFSKKNEIIVNEHHVCYANLGLTDFNIVQFEHLQNLKYLNLSGNKLTEISPLIFTTFPKLTWFDLRDNRLKRFPNVTAEHLHLEVLLLGRNRITELPIELGSWPRLRCVQVTENPLTFPKLSAIGHHKCDLVSFLRLCWEQQTKEPSLNLDKTKILKKTKSIKELKATNLKPAYIGDENNLIVDQMKSNDPNERYDAEETLIHLRQIDKDIQRLKDRETLRIWREKYKMANARPTFERFGSVPFGLDSEFMQMMNRNEIYKIHPNQKMKPVKLRKRNENLDEELLKLQEALNKIKNRDACSTLNAAEEMARRSQEMKMIHQIQRKIKTLQLKN